MTTLMQCACGLKGPADRLPTGDSTRHQEFHVHSKDHPVTHRAVVSFDAEAARFVTVCKGEVYKPLHTNGSLLLTSTYDVCNTVSMSNTPTTVPLNSRCWQFAVSSVLPLSFVGIFLQATGVIG